MKQHASIDNDAAILAAADHFEITLFLGTGKFSKAEAATISHARVTAAKLSEANPHCSRRPIIYAVTAAGRAAPVT